MLSERCPEFLREASRTWLGPKRSTNFPARQSN
jgi:hypothetical protein